VKAEDGGVNIVKYKAPGGIENLGVVGSDDPGPPGPNEIRVRIHGSSLNGHDYNLALGILPVEEGRVLLSDGAGEVEAVGSNVKEFAVGTTLCRPSFPIGRREMRRVQASLELQAMASMDMQLKWSSDRRTSLPVCPTTGVSRKLRLCLPLG
jgi:NADPH:quinone reductase-like Zn-dependent oxidoreductase